MPLYINNPSSSYISPYPNGIPFLPSFSVNTNPSNRLPWSKSTIPSTTIVDCYSLYEISPIWWFPNTFNTFSSLTTNPWFIISPLLNLKYCTFSITQNNGIPAIHYHFIIHTSLHALDNRSINMILIVNNIVKWSHVICQNKNEYRKSSFSGVNLFKSSIRTHTSSSHISFPITTHPLFSLPPTPFSNSFSNKHIICFYAECCYKYGYTDCPYTYSRRHAAYSAS